MDLVTIFIALETTSIAQFVLSGIARDDRGAEAGLKYLLRDNVAVGVKAYFVDRIINPSHDPAAVTLQADLEVKF